MTKDPVALANSVSVLHAVLIHLRHNPSAAPDADTDPVNRQVKHIVQRVLNTTNTLMEVGMQQAVAALLGYGSFITTEAFVFCFIRPAVHYVKTNLPESRQRPTRCPAVPVSDADDRQHVVRGTEAQAAAAMAFEDADLDDHDEANDPLLASEGVGGAEIYTLPTRGRKKAKRGGRGASVCSMVAFLQDAVEELVVSVRGATVNVESALCLRRLRLPTAMMGVEQGKGPRPRLGPCADGRRPDWAARGPEFPPPASTTTTTTTWRTRNRTTRRPRPSGGRATPCTASTLGTPSFALRAAPSLEDQDHQQASTTEVPWATSRGTEQGLGEGGTGMGRSWCWCWCWCCTSRGHLRTSSSSAWSRIGTRHASGLRPSWTRLPRTPSVAGRTPPVTATPSSPWTSSRRRPLTLPAPSSMVCRFPPTGRSRPSRPTPTSPNTAYTRSRPWRMGCRRRWRIAWAFPITAGGPRRAGFRTLKDMCRQRRHRRHVHP